MRLVALYKCYTPLPLSELGSWRLVETIGDVRAYLFLLQRISVAVQRFNFVVLHAGFH